MRTIHFHSYAAKTAFVKAQEFNWFHKLVESETPGSITFNDESEARFYSNSPFVYQTSE